MAFGFPASYKTRIQLSCSRRAARAAIVYAFESLGWRYMLTTHDVFTARNGISMTSWGETITVSLENAGVAEITSKCGFPQVFDWGKNKQNIKAFLAHFVSKADREEMLDHNEPVYLDDQGNTPVERVLNDRDE